MVKKLSPSYLKHSMQARFLVFTFLIVTVPLTVMGILILNQSRRVLQEKIKYDLAIQSSLLSSSMNRWLDDRVKDIKVFANMPATIAMNPEGIRSYLETMDKENAFYTGIAVHDRNGDTVANLADTKPNIKDRPYFQAAMNGQTSVFGPVISRADGNLIIIIATPILRQDEVIGMALLAIPTNALNEMIQASMPGNKTDVYLINSESMFVTPSFFTESLKQKGLIENQTELELKVNSFGASQALAGHSGVSEYYVDYRETRVVGAYTPLKYSGLALLIEQEATEAYLPWKETRDYFILLIILVAFVSSIIGLITSRTLAKPIEKITKAARKITEGDLDISLDINRSDEVGELARAFDQMTRRLHESFSSLTESENRFRALSENTLAGVFIVQNGVIRYANQSLARILGYSLEDLIGTQIEDIIHPDSYELVMENMRRRLEDDSSQIQYECRLIRKDGQVINVVVLGGRLIYEGKPAPMGTLLDITERIRAREEIMKFNAELEKRVNERTEQLNIANRELGAFSYSISHDLQGPLRRIVGYSRMLAEDYDQKLDETGKHYIDNIVTVCKQMDQLINDLLRLSRVTHVEMQISEINLSDMAQEIIHNFRQAEPERNVEFKAAASISVRADYNLMRIALENLLGNAWKYTSKKPDAVIELGTMQLDNMKTAYYVRDNGIGFDMADHDKMFNAFQRLDTAQDFEGTGIGLALVKRIINRLGGDIWAESKIDQGSTFYFTLDSNFTHSN
jgi:PAS domain S-box-containing protein